VRYRQASSPNPVLIIIIVNVVVYIATLVEPGLVRELGLYAGSNFLNQPWGIFTSLFVHGGLWHILANMLTFFFFGSTLSNIVGSRRMLIIYFLGGLIGGAFFVLLAPSLYMAVGASGAIFALGGALAVLRPKLPVMIFPIPAPMPLWVATIIIFLILTFLPGVAWQAHLGGFLSGVAWQAHLGGLLSGAAMGYLVLKRKF
jgi:membrane associated rhomboid family serine protease